MSHIKEAKNKLDNDSRLAPENKVEHEKPRTLAKLGKVSEADTKLETVKQKTIEVAKVLGVEKDEFLTMVGELKNKFPDKGALLNHYYSTDKKVKELDQVRIHLDSLWKSDLPQVKSLIGEIQKIAKTLDDDGIKVAAARTTLGIINLKNDEIIDDTKASTARVQAKDGISDIEKKVQVAKIQLEVAKYRMAQERLYVDFTTGKVVELKPDDNKVEPILAQEGLGKSESYIAKLNRYHQASQAEGEARHNHDNSTRRNHYRGGYRKVDELDVLPDGTIAPGSRRDTSA